MKNWGLVLILALALALRLPGFTFGLPNREHAYTYNPDEWTSLQALEAMDPAHLDFNPHYFFNPTFQVYAYGALLALGHAAGMLKINGDEKFYFDNPDHLGRMVLLCRIYSLILGLAGIVLLYLLARRMGLDRTTSHLAALLLALHPSHVIQSHYMTVNLGLTFWVLLAFLGMESWIRRGGTRNIVWVGAAIGLALSTKYTGALLFPIAGLAGLVRWRRAPGVPFRRVFGETAAVMAIGLVAFVAGTPYVVLAAGEFFSGFSAMVGFFQSSPADPTGLARSLRNVATVHLFASTPFLLIAALGGFVVMLRRRPSLWIPVTAWLGIFAVLTLRAGSLSTDGRFMPLFPFIVILGATGLGALLIRRRRAGVAALAAVVALLLFADVTYLGRFIGPAPQEQASTWARDNLTGSPKVFLTGSAIFYSPNWPLREYLQRDNAANYRRETTWTFVDARTYAEGRAADPDVVFLSLYLPFEPVWLEWLKDPAYEVVATFPGKVRLFGRPVAVRLDLFDVYIWVLRRKASTVRE